ncbi:hypothetical protein [Nocardioides sp.]|uniref:hypothetical protein n=1 Tax=Nocardioides sp. TaxID=35761 RepID=UPI0039E4ABC8
METDTDWTDLLDRAIPTPPAGGWDEAAALTRGRIALRRRRLATGAGGGLAAVALAALSWAALPATTSPVETSFATEVSTEPAATSSAPSPSSTPTTVGITFDATTGELQLARGWKVTGEIPGVLPAGPMAGESFVPTGSTAIQATDGTSVEWAVQWWDDALQMGHLATVANVDPDDTTGFTAWLDAQIARLYPGTDVTAPPLLDPATAGRGAAGTDDLGRLRSRSDATLTAGPGR